MYNSCVQFSFNSDFEISRDYVIVYNQVFLVTI